MEKILQWSVAQQDPETAGNVPAPTQAQLAQLFGGAGADDPTLMKQSIQIIQSPDIDDLEVKLTAFENYEMLIENLDNANNIENLKHWEILIEQLDSTNDEFKNFAASIIGIAVQNNDVSQTNFLKYADLGFPKLIKLSKEEKNIKALFALSSIIRNNNESLPKFDQHNGWELLGDSASIKDSSDKYKVKLFSLLNSLLTLDDKSRVLQKIQDHKLINHILDSITEKSEVNLVDRSLHLITSLINHGYELTDEEKSKVHSVVGVIDAHFKDVVNENDFQVLKQV